MEPTPSPVSHTRVFDLQRNMVSHMTVKSWRTIPHVSYLYEPDVTEFYEVYKELAKSFTGQGRRLSFNTIMLKALIEGLKASPEMNATVDYHYSRGVGSLKRLSTINMAVAWNLADGRMITPVIYDVGKKNLVELVESVVELERKIAQTNIDELIYEAVIQDTLNELKHFNLAIFLRILAHIGRVHGLTGQARRDYARISPGERLTAHDLLDASITVSNIGSLDKGQRGYFSLLEIIPPQVVTFGLGAIQEKPGVYLDENGQQVIGVRKFLPVCLVFDHRALDFSSLLPFVHRLDDLFAHPEEMNTW